MQDSKSFDTQNNLPIFSAAKSGNYKCIWCGGTRHERIACPARDATCKNCKKKGHWASVCLSRNKKRFAAISESKKTESNEEGNLDGVPDSQIQNDYIASSILASVIGKGLIKASLNGFPIKALVDTGSDLSFVSVNFLTTHNISFVKTYKGQLHWQTSHH